ncbi:MAG: hypothetical protein L6R42_006722, partial [Xanthoria sp. 1 TBL-2021]
SAQQTKNGIEQQKQAALRRCANPLPRLSWNQVKPMNRVLDPRALWEHAEF